MSDCNVNTFFEKSYAKNWPWTYLAYIAFNTSEFRASPLSHTAAHRRCTAHRGPGAGASRGKGSAGRHRPRDSGPYATGVDTPADALCSTPRAPPVTDSGTMPH